ncbi:hypothetical protein H5410_020318 [Solanum commersonii]|uniref:Bet v I/Major latex protein domain-containing protein n=1 Tax=Solanum commersonii TaxID=4109 RepID=A0A9J5Z9Q6_SOLCO|nr:hypothetical protein H5410_020318 [Solanum commersonii]
MDVKGKLIASIELKCGGHSIHDIFHIKTPHIPNISSSKILSFKFLKGETIKISKQVIEAVDPQTKSITWKVIGKDLLELYNFFTAIISRDYQCTTWSFMYEKKIEEVLEPLVLLGFTIDLTRDIEGKLICSVEVKCGGHLIHDLFHTNTHHIPNICRGKINHFEIHEGGSVKVGSVVSWKYNDDGKDKIAKQLYNSFTIITSCDKQWTTWTFVYEKKTEETPEPLVLLGFALDLTKDIEGHLLKK